MNTKPVASAIRLCVNCRFFLPYEGHPDARASLATCGRSATVFNPVDGTERHRFCDTERDNNLPGHCGPHGSYYQPAA